MKHKIKKPFRRVIAATQQDGLWYPVVMTRDENGIVEVRAYVTSMSPGYHSKKEAIRERIRQMKID